MHDQLLLPDVVYEVPVLGMIEHRTNCHIVGNDDAGAAAERVAAERG
jgi:hypothetical protein